MFQIETERLILRDLQPEDEPAIRALRMDPAVTKYIDYIHSPTPEAVHDWVVGTIDHNARDPRLSWNLATVRKRDGNTLGWIGMGQASTPGRGDLNFGYALLKEHWGQGYATEALRALVDWAFRDLDTTRIYGECDAANIASARVIVKAGFLPDPAPGPENEVRFTLSREVWEAADRRVNV